MILEYHRPQTLEEALSLLARRQPRSVPLAGGTLLNRPGSEAVAAVDLQDLRLNSITLRGTTLELGAATTLQAALQSGHLPAALCDAIRLETTYNLRQVATVAGTLVGCDGRSPFTTALLALDASLQIEPQAETLALGDLLPLRSERLEGRLITQVSLPAQVRLACSSVARSPADWPLVYAALAAWPSGRLRLALGGYGASPLLVLDGAGSAGLEAAASSAYSQAGDQWASAEYRSATAAVLARRCLETLS